jgi:hypothetical protein
MNKKNVEDVLIAISQKIKSNYAVLFRKDYKQGSKNMELIEIQKGVSQVIFTAVGKKPSMMVYDSFNKKYQGRALGDNGQTLIVDNPSNGIWTVHSEDGFSYSIEIGGLVEDTYDYGFSLEIPNNKRETSYQPIIGKPIHSILKLHIICVILSGSKNVLSVFVSNPQYAGILRTIKLFQDGREIRSLLLRKIRNDLYVTDPVSFEERSFKVGFSGTDSEHKSFERIVSTVLNSGKSKIRFYFYLIHC